MSVRILIGDVRDRLRDLPDDSVDCVVTSPPYWGLRDYGVDGQIGMEHTLGEHIATLVEVFSEARRVVKPKGAVWINYGDCYASSPNGRSAADTKAAGNDDRTFRDKPFSTVGPIYEVDETGRQVRRGGRLQNLHDRKQSPASNGRIVAGGFLKPKDLCLIPFRLAIALQEDGWWVRSRCVWGKPQPMPDSSGKWRPSVAHEEIFLLSKSGDLYYDPAAVAAPASTKTNSRVPKRVKMPDGWDTGEGGHGSHHRQGREKGKTHKQDANERWKNAPGVTPKSAGEDTNVRAKGSFHATTTAVLDTRFLRTYEPEVWHIATQAFTEAHFATFPPALVERCLLASLPPGGVVLDPFGGSGTVGLVADGMGSDAILIELNEEYAEIARRRIGDAFRPVWVDRKEPRQTAFFAEDAAE